MNTPATILSLAFLTAAHAWSRTSINYSIPADTLDSGGQTVTSADYSIQGSLGPIGGTSSANSAGIAILAHSGFVGEIYNLLGYGLLASDSYPPEEGSTQIITVRTADDGTNVVIPTTGFTFAALEGPIPSISPTGLVETATVYENTQAIVGATSDFFSGQLQLLLFVQDTLPDNYTSYAADGLPDAWQRQYFGLDNPLAAPLSDPDGDGQNNRFEYTAGVSPTDTLSLFQLRILPVPGFPSRKDIVFSPRLADRTYVVKSNLQLAGPWLPLADSVTGDSGLQRTVTDRQATEPKKFYHVEITKP